MQKIRLGELVNEYKRQFPNGAVHYLYKLEPYAEWTMFYNVTDVDGVKTLSINLEPPENEINTRRKEGECMG